MVAKYKILIVEVQDDYPEKTMCSIGTFDSEEVVIKWMEENKGELAKC